MDDGLPNKHNLSVDVVGPEGGNCEDLAFKEIEPKEVAIPDEKLSFTSPSSHVQKDDFKSDRLNLGAKRSCKTDSIAGEASIHGATSKLESQLNKLKRNKLLAFSCA